MRHLTWEGTGYGDSMEEKTVFEEVGEIIEKTHKCKFCGELYDYWDYVYCLPCYAKSKNFCE